MVSKNQKSIIDRHTQKRDSNPNTRDTHQITLEESKRRRKEQKRTIETSPKTANKLAVSADLSIIIFFIEV